MRFRVSQAVADRIALRLPEGKTIQDVRILRVAAQILPMATASLAERTMIASEVEKAGGPAMVTQGKPTVMRVVAWMAHEGINKNRLQFNADDFGTAAEQIREPNFLPMDWNHSAVDPWAWDAKAIGLWYKAEKRWDPKANDGAGAYGILAQGVMWAWAFPEYANVMLAEQERHGKIDFSMACIPTSVTIARDADGAYEIAHQPVFFTLSALDVPPADPACVGLGVEGSDDDNLEAQLSAQLGATDGPAVIPPQTAQKTAASTTDGSTDLTEDQMKTLEELTAALAAMQVTLDAQAAQIAAASTASADLATATARIAELEAQVEEAATAREAVTAEATTSRTSAEERIAALETELAAATARLTEIDSAAATQAATARYASRLAELPESYRAALQKRSEEARQKFEQRWTAATDEQWADFKDDLTFNVASVRFSYLAASEAEGGALATGGAAEGMAALLGEMQPK